MLHGELDLVVGRLTADFDGSGLHFEHCYDESMSILTNNTLLQESDMLGVMPHNVAGYCHKLGLLDLLDVPLPPPSGPVGIITRAVSAPTPAADDLIETLRASGRELARG